MKRQAKHPDRTRRQASAEGRKLLRSNFTPQQKLARLDAEGYVAKKERTKLLAQIEGQQTGGVRKA